jgi:hypothetical protein
MECTRNHQHGDRTAHSSLLTWAICSAVVVAPAAAYGAVEAGIAPVAAAPAAPAGALTLGTLGRVPIRAGVLGCGGVILLVSRRRKFL